MTPANFPIIAAALDGRTTVRFGKALETLAQYEADPVITKTEQKDLADQFYRVFEEALKAAVKEPFVYAGRWEALTEAERKLEQALFMPYCHVVASYLKKAEAFKGESKMRDAALGLLRECAPLAARVIALKEKIGKRAPKPTKTSIARDDRDAKAMTCQCCARKILAETGQIAHHGYERPGQGYQTASCPGALHLPFEVSRERLGVHIEGVRASLTTFKDATVKIAREEIGFAWTYKAKGENAWSPVDRQVIVTRDTFDEIIRTWAAERQYQETQPTFDYLKKSHLARREGHVHREQAYIDGQQHRYDHWTQTHERRGDAWVELEVAA